MKKYIFLWILLFVSCVPASKKALEETNQNVLAIAKHNQLQDKTIGLIGKKVFGETFNSVDSAIKRSSDAIANQAEETGKKDVGIFDFSAIKNSIVGLIKDGLNIAVDLASSTPYGPFVTVAVGAVTAWLGKGGLDGILARRKEKVKKEVLKRQDPNDAKKYDDLLATVQKEIKDGKIKV